MPDTPARLTTIEQWLQAQDEPLLYDADGLAAHAALPRYYILDGHTPVPVEDVTTWLRFFAQSTSLEVAATDLTASVAVSTVFVGLDLGDGSEPPLVFESLVCGLPEGHPLHLRCARSASWEAAEAGHVALVAQVRAALNGGGVR